MPVEKRWHEAVVGYGGTTLNAYVSIFPSSLNEKHAHVLGRIIGEDTTLSIKVGAEAGDATNSDIIVSVALLSMSDRAVKHILKIVEDAKNDEIINSYVSTQSS